MSRAAVLAILLLLAPAAIAAEDEELPWGQQPALRVGKEMSSKADVGRRLLGTHGPAIVRSAVTHAQLQVALGLKGLTVPEETVKAERDFLLARLEERGMELEQFLRRAHISRAGFDRNAWSGAAARILGEKVGVHQTQIHRYLAVNAPIRHIEDRDDAVFLVITGGETPVEILVKPLVEELLPLLGTAERNRFLDGVVNAEVIEQALRHSTLGKPSPETLEQLEKAQRDHLRAVSGGQATLEGILESRGQSIDEWRTALLRTERVRRQVLHDLEPTEEDLRAHFTRWVPFFEGKLVRASTIFVATKSPGGEKEWAEALATATEIRKEALAGADFGDLAMRRSDDPRTKIRRGDLGFFPRKGPNLPAELAAAAFSQKQGVVGEPLRGAAGYHVILVTAIRPGEPTTFEEARRKVEKDWADSRRLQWLEAIREGVEVEVLWEELKVREGE